LAQRLNDKWNVPVIVENRPGAGNTIGANAVAKAAPDGYTLLYANTSISTNPSLFKSLPYDTLRDLAPVTYLSPSPNVLLVQKTLGVTTLKDLLALAKSRQDKPLSYASVGKGSAHHFCMELLKSEARIPLLHVPYRGVAPAVVAVTRGEVDLFCADVTAALGLLQGDKVTPLAITSRKRSPALPDVAPFAELGLPNYEQTGYVGIMVTGGTPAPIIAKLNTSINEVLLEPEFNKKFTALGYDMVGGTVQGLRKISRRRYPILSSADASRWPHAGVARARVRRRPNRALTRSIATTTSPAPSTSQPGRIMLRSSKSNAVPKTRSGETLNTMPMPIASAMKTSTATTTREREQHPGWRLVAVLRNFSSSR
jgi:tripartite-type tricarboxylate transporter receptor subunit TctC